LSCELYAVIVVNNSYGVQSKTVKVFTNVYLRCALDKRGGKEQVGLISPVILSLPRKHNARKILLMRLD